MEIYVSGSQRVHLGQCPWAEHHTRDCASLLRHETERKGFVISFSGYMIVPSLKKYSPLHWFSQFSAFSTRFLFQSLQNKSYNHFAAIYFLLVERLKSHRSSFPVEQRLDGRQRRPSTIAEQTVAKVTTTRLIVHVHFYVGHSFYHLVQKVRISSSTGFS